MEECLRIVKTRWFVRFARAEGISDARLAEAIDRAERGLIDADLGGGVIKQRVARPGRGRSGGYRVLVAYRRDALSVFMYGFAKNARDNIDDDQLATLREIAEGWFGASSAQIARAIDNGVLQEVERGEREKN